VVNNLSEAEACEDGDKVVKCRVKFCERESYHGFHHITSSSHRIVIVLPSNTKMP
jgi:hypothetical protein